MFVTSILRLMQSISSPNAKANGFCLTVWQLVCWSPPSVTDRATMQENTHLQNGKLDSWQQSRGLDWWSFLVSKMFISVLCVCVTSVSFQQFFLNSTFLFRATYTKQTDHNMIRDAQHSTVNKLLAYSNTRRWSVLHNRIGTFLKR